MMMMMILLFIIIMWQETLGLLKGCILENHDFSIQNYLLEIKEKRKNYWKWILSDKENFLPRILFLSDEI